MDKLDKSFDGLADRFESRIYGSLKGRIRQAVLWRDINTHLEQYESQGSQFKALKVLDVGAGLGAVSIELAKRGHTVIYNDLSKEMLDKAQRSAKDQNVYESITWSNESYQSFCQRHNEQNSDLSNYDLIVCHALLEWLEKPQALIATLSQLLKPDGFLSLCFYNPAGLIFRNLIYGNFHMATTTFDMKADIGSLTPRQSSSVEQVKAWLANEQLEIKQASGIRVFNDYAMQKRGGNEIPEEAIKMELEFSQREPFIWLARYIHLLCQPKNIK